MDIGIVVWPLEVILAMCMLILLLWEFLTSKNIGEVATLSKLTMVCCEHYRR